MSGKGGDGCSSFRREKHVPFGGPDGGDGGRGGDVVLVATRRRTTLLELRGHSIWKARSGEPGRTRNCRGACADSIRISVPVGTRVFDARSGEQLVDLVADGEEWIAAKGGFGGLGNTRFKSSVNRAPRRFTPGKPGEERFLRLELLLMADIGLLGFPNAGKSTLISKVSAARPKVAGYPFTTLAPSLGVVDMGIEGTYVVADIPGLIPGASEGAGLGHQFLRHVGRTRVLLHLLSLEPGESMGPLERYKAIRHELEAFDSDLCAKSEIVVLTKTDLFPPEEVEKMLGDVRAALPDRSVWAISSATGEGVRDLKNGLWRLLQGLE